MRGLNKKNVVVTGGASGIGFACAQRFVEEGGNVVIADLNAEAGREAAYRLGAKASFVQVDVACWSSVKQLIDEAQLRLGSIDVLLNNAGIGSSGFVTDMPLEHWQRVIEVNLNSVFYGCRAAIPVMKKQGSGAIINTASISGLAADHGASAYNATKGAIVNFTRALAIDHIRHGVRINAVCPGPVDTPILDAARAVPGVVEAWHGCSPIKRFARPEEIAGAVAFLASDDAGYVVGANLVIDGGISITTGQPNFTQIVRDLGYEID